jgi:hypothetical protein
MKRIVQAVLALAVVALAIWLWTVMFPSPERVIRSRVNALAKTLSFDSGGGILAQALKAQEAGDFFTTNVDVEINVSGYDTLSLHGRDEVVQGAAAVRSRLTSLKVEIPDMNITIDPDQQSAKVNLTAKATVSGERDISAQEFNFMMKKVDGKWLIYRVESVKTLSLLRLAPRKQAPVC